MFFAHIHLLHRCGWSSAEQATIAANTADSAGWRSSWQRFVAVVDCQPFWISVIIEVPATECQW